MPKTHSPPRAIHPSGRKRPTRTRLAATERRDAILDAALSVFAAQGFAAARLDDVAAKAGVAKGTLYLYFADKESLFEELLRRAVSPALFEVAKIAAARDLPAREVFEQIMAFLKGYIFGTPREALLRLLISEGHRFPRIAEFYYTEVVAKGRGLIAALAARAVARGELSCQILVKYPQLFFAPVLLSVVWNGTFAKFEQLDVPGLLDAHLNLIFGEKPKGQD